MNIGTLKTLPASFKVPLCELRDMDFGIFAHPKSTFRIGLLIPMCGSAGIWGPSCISSAQVAVAELNQSGGICGRPVELIMIDSALEAPTPVEEVINSLIDIRAIDAIVGMHISAVRQNLSKIIKQRIPYVYTPLYEGGETTKGIFAIGDTPDRQLGPALAYFNSERKIKRWALIGNDYVWPRASNSYAKRKFSELGAKISLERYLPFGFSGLDSLVDVLAHSDAQAILISLVGQDAVNFNRAFGAMGLHKKMLRFSCAIEENSLLACGAENLKELYSAASYFGSLNTTQNILFKEKYFKIHGECAPVLNALGQSTYEGIQFLCGLLENHKHDWKHKSSTSVSGVSYTSVRRKKTENGTVSQSPIYLAKANGIMFDILQSLN